jgi:hypothetical protein
MAIEFAPDGYIYIRVERMAWNLNTQKRHLKHTDAPPEDCDAWEPYASSAPIGYSSRYKEEAYQRTTFHSAMATLLDGVEREPNRWWRLVAVGATGYQGSHGFVYDRGSRYNRRTVVLLGPFCAEKGVLPELEKVEERYEFPFNLPEGLSTIPWDPAKPEFGEAPRPTLETTVVDPGTQIVVLDDWGLPVKTTEVI